MAEVAEVPKVQIDDLLKIELFARLDTDRAIRNPEGMWEIRKSCILCLKFLHANGNEDKCADCPFGKIGGTGYCRTWIKRVLNGKPAFDLSVDFITWQDYQNRKARQQLRRLCEAAKNPELVEWVERKTAEEKPPEETP